MQPFRVVNRVTIRWLSFTSPAAGRNHDRCGELARPRLRTVDSGVELLGYERSFLWYINKSRRSSSPGYFADMAPFVGGDDLKMKGWDIRQGFDCPVFENRR